MVKNLDSRDPFAKTAGEVLAKRLGDRYPDAFAEVTGMPLWDDRAGYARTQRKWERHAERVLGSQGVDWEKEAGR